MRDDDTIEESDADSTLKTPPTYRITVEIDYEEGEPFGLKVNKDLTIRCVEKNMRAEGLLLVGDQLLTINETHIEDVDHFFKLLQKLFPQIRIEVERKLWRAPLTNLRAKHIGLLNIRKRREYFIAYIYRIEGIKLGLTIKESRKKVYIAKIKPDSLGSNCFKEGDRIFDVNGLRVYTKKEAREMFVQGLKENSFVSSVVERKLSPDDQSSSRALLFVGDTHEKMPLDAIKIGKREAARIKAHEGLNFPIKPILVKGSEAQVRPTSDFVQILIRISLGASKVRGHKETTQQKYKVKMIRNSPDVESRWCEVQQKCEVTLARGRSSKNGAV